MLYVAHCWTMGNKGEPRWDRNWSIESDGLADDIRQATDLVGPIDLRNVGMTMLTSGRFTKAVERMGLTSPPVPDEEILALCWSLLAPGGGHG